MHGPPEYLKPTDKLVAIVTDALIALSRSTEDMDDALLSDTGFSYISLCSEDPSFETFLSFSGPLLRTARYALERYETEERAKEHVLCQIEKRLAS